MTTRIEELMTRWSTWKMHGSSRGGGFGRCMTEIVISGLKGTLCRTCLGEKFIKVWLGGHGQYVPCDTCKAAGHIILRGKGVNPAMIPSTFTGFNDPVAEKINLIIYRLIEPQWRVVEETYTGWGDLKYKAAHLRMSVPVFSRHLDDAIVQIECRYYDRFPKIIHEQSTPRLLEA